MELKYKQILVLPFKEPFSFEKTFFIPSHFNSGLELYFNDEYYITIKDDIDIYGLKFYFFDNKLWLEVYSHDVINDNKTKRIIDYITFKFSLDVDFSEFYDKFRNDNFLCDIIERNKGKHFNSIYSLYEGLIISTLLQNTTVKRTISMCNTILDKYGQKVSFADKTLSALWFIKDFTISEQELRDLKLGYRAKNIVKITDQFKNNSFSEERLQRLNTEELEKELIKIYGVGKQTVFYLMLSQFHRTDYLKHIPFWERKILSRYIFDKELVDEDYLVEWFHKRYENWCGYALSIIMEDVFFLHKKDAFPWLKVIMREK